MSDIQMTDTNELENNPKKIINYNDLISNSLKEFTNLVKYVYKGIIDEHGYNINLCNDCLNIFEELSSVLIMIVNIFIIDNNCNEYKKILEQLKKYKYMKNEKLKLLLSYKIINYINLNKYLFMEEYRILFSELKKYIDYSRKCHNNNII
jgi:hypothetical protein